MTTERKNMIDRYFVKAPVTGWHEVDKEHFDSFVKHIRKNATPSIPMETLLKRITRVIATEA